MKSKFNLKPTNGVLEFSLTWDGKALPQMYINNASINCPEYTGHECAAYFFAVAEFIKSRAEEVSAELITEKFK